ncbi:MAG: hypothetical protein ABH833_03935 [Parcubacteria group bacterium]
MQEKPPQRKSDKKEKVLSAGDKKLFQDKLAIIKGMAVPDVPPGYEITSDQEEVLKGWNLEPPRTKALAKSMMEYVMSAEGMRGKDSGLKDERIQDILKLQEEYPRGSIVVCKEGKELEPVVVLDVLCRSPKRRRDIQLYMSGEKGVRLNNPVVHFELVVMFRSDPREPKIKPRSFFRIRKLDQVLGSDQT